jgi:hypothetical protein
MRLRDYFILTGWTILIIALGLAVSTATAAPPLYEASSAGLLPPAETFTNDACLACHQNPQFSVTLENGDLYDLYVDPDEFNHSVHGTGGYLCVQCHVDFKPEMGHGFNFNNRREATLLLNESCGECHQTQASQERDSAHAAARAAGNLEAAVCTDCHTAHAINRLKDPSSGELLPEARAWIPTTCQKCHSDIYEKYRNSVHGAALTDDGNPDVPTCIDCHGVHIIEDPTTTMFRLSSPQMCAKCHTDPQVMDKYGLSTQVLDTYVADFHGTTVTIFEKVSPDAITNKPVCFDCHGIHDITRVDDPQKGLQVKENLLIKCQTCHEDAEASFPDAWMSHYIPSPEKYPIVYYVDLFYKFLIPGVLIPMAILVLMDFSRMMINRFRKPRLAGEVEAHETLEEPGAGEDVLAAEESADTEEKAAGTEDVEAVEMPVETEAGEKSAPDESPTPVELPIESDHPEQPAEYEPDEDIEPDEKGEDSSEPSDEEPRHD